MRSLLLLAAAAAAAWAWADAPSDATLRYRMSYSGIHIADVTDTLRFEPDGSFVIDSAARSVGLAKAFNLGDVHRISTGRLRATGLPQTDTYEHNHGDRRRRAEVDYAAGTAAWVDHKGVPGEAPITEETVMDLLVLQYLFYMRGTAAAAGQAQVVDGRRLQTYTFARSEAPEAVQVDFGSFDALRYERTDNPDKKRSFWVAPELMLLPVKVRIVNNGSVIEFELVDAQLGQP